jgi:hypothetical protein
MDHTNATCEAHELFNIASRVSSYVTGLDMVLMEETGLLEVLGEQISKDEIGRQQYSPIFKAMSEDEKGAYDELAAEIAAVGKMSLIVDAAKPSLSDTFISRVSVASIKMQELLVSVAVRAGLLTEEELIDQMGQDSRDELHVALLYKNDAPLLSLIVQGASLRP